MYQSEQRAMLRERNGWLDKIPLEDDAEGDDDEDDEEDDDSNNNVDDGSSPNSLRDAKASSSSLKHQRNSSHRNLHNSGLSPHNNSHNDDDGDDEDPVSAFQTRLPRRKVHHYDHNNSTTNTNSNSINGNHSDVDGETHEDLDADTTSDLDKLLRALRPVDRVERMACLALWHGDLDRCVQILADAALQLRQSSSSTSSSAPNAPFSVHQSTSSSLVTSASASLSAVESELADCLELCAMCVAGFEPQEQRQPLNQPSNSNVVQVRDAIVQDRIYN